MTLVSLLNDHVTLTVTSEVGEAVVLGDCVFVVIVVKEVTVVEVVVVVVDEVVDVVELVDGVEGVVVVVVVFCPSLKDRNMSKNAMKIFI